MTDDASMLMVWFPRAQVRARVSYVMLLSCRLAVGATDAFILTLVQP